MIPEVLRRMMAFYWYIIVYPLFVSSYMAAARLYHFVREMH